MVYYTDETPGVNKRLVAGYYLFLCLIGFAILLGPTGSGIPITIFSDRVREAHELADPSYGNGCLDGTCHNEEWTYWNQTTHSGYLIEYDPDSDTITVNGHRNRTMTEFNASCAQCHAIGWTPERNVTDWPNTHDGFGTNCFTCHDATSPYYSVNGSNCASCHIHEGHGGLDGWTESAHANSLTDLRGSSHAGSECMHCMSVEGFLDQDADLDPAGPYNPLTCPACHSVHSADIANPAMIRAVNATELCGLCHTGSRHGTYDVWKGGPHDLTGIVECTSCHGFREGDHGPEMNHTFSVLPEDACNQTACHEGQLDWALTQMEEIQSSFDALVTDFTTEADAFETIVMEYNATADADYELVDYVLGIVDDASTTVGYYGYDGSSGFHDPMETFDALNGAFRDLLDAKAYFYENMPEPTTPTPVGGFDTLIVVGGAAGGIVVGLLLGVLVGRRR
ncbi:MAG: multiheme c-type cytochrome [Candidatus Thorarchaeota archaeon]